MKWNRRNIFCNGLISKIYKEFIQLNSNQPTKQTNKKQLHLKNRPNVSIDIFSKEDIQMANKHRKRCFISVIINEMQIHTNRNYPLISTKIAIIKKSTNKCWQGCGEKKYLNTVGGNVNWCSQYEKHYEGSSENKTTSRASNPTPGHILGESCQLKG